MRWSLEFRPSRLFAHDERAHLKSFASRTRPLSPFPLPLQIPSFGPAVAIQVPLQRSTVGIKAVPNPLNVPGSHHCLLFLGAQRPEHYWRYRPGLYPGIFPPGSRLP